MSDKSESTPTKKPFPTDLPFEFCRQCGKVAVWDGGDGPQASKGIPAEAGVNDHAFFMVVGLLMAVFATDWRWSVTGAVLAIAGLVVALVFELKTKRSST